jgi:AraC family transcriptional regulator
MLETPGVKASEVAYPPGLCVGRHWHTTANLIYIIAGTHWSGYSRGGEICAPQTVRFLPAGELHENYFPVESRCLAFELSQPLLDLAAEHGRTVQAPGEVARPAAAGLGERLFREFRRHDDVAPVDIEAAILELLLTDASETTTRRRPIPSWLLRVREMLRDERPTLAALSRAVGRHPVQVSRQFHQYFGCTISEYVRRVRVARAQSLLSRGDSSIAQVALACGFCDQSHFTMAFHRLTGLAPRQWVMAKK